MSQCVLLLMLLPVASVAQQSDLRLPIDVSADSTEFDGLNSMVVMKGLRLSQGRVQVRADEGRATRLDFEDSVWQFEGNVIIEVEDSRIECNSAEVTFIDLELTKANVSGSPATFRLQDPGTDEVTYAEGGQLDYDVTTAVVTFTDNVKITEGSNQITSSYLVYNIRE
ncbi:MAG: LptA/OstA family protein, partial [Pseudomonadota bacterium]